MEFRGKDLAFNFLTLGLMFPISVAILPVYLVLRQLHITNTLAAVILVETAFGISGNILILRGFFLAVPAELQDAAAIDGCSTFDFYWRILMPLVRPALAAVGAFSLADTARLLKLRGMAMQAAVPVGVGAMAAPFHVRA